MSEQTTDTFGHQKLGRSMTMDAWKSAASEIEKIKCARVLRVTRYRIEQWMSFFAVLSVIGTALIMQFGVVSETQIINLSKEHVTLVVNVLRSVISISTVFMLGLLYYRYDTVCKLRIVSHQLPPHTEFYSPNSGLLGKILIETIIILLHVPPSWSHIFIDHRFMSASIYNSTTKNSSCPTTDHQLDSDLFCYRDIPWHNSQLDAIVFLRLYTLFRRLRHRLGFEAVDIEWLGTEWHVHTHSLAFTAKFIFHEHPVRFAMFAFALTWCFTSIIVEFMEHLINPAINSILEALWLTVLTMSSAGLGSTPPFSLQGQISIVVGGIIGGAIMGALITSVLIESLRVTEDEDSVISTLETRRLETARQISAIHVLENFARYVVSMKKKSSSSSLRAARTKIFWSALKFKNYRHELAHLSNSALKVLDGKKADLIHRTTNTHIGAPIPVHTIATLDTLERKLHAIHGALQVARRG